MTRPSVESYPLPGLDELSHQAVQRVVANFATRASAACPSASPTDSSPEAGTPTSPGATARQKSHHQLLLIDATCGNGHDTLFLAKCLAQLPPEVAGNVLAFDVQQEALNSTQKAIETAGYADAPVSLLLQSHALLEDAVRSRFPSVIPTRAAAPYIDDHVVPSLAENTEAVASVAGSAIGPLTDGELPHSQAPQNTSAILAAVVYNLGFLPRSDKQVVTLMESTLASLDQARVLLARRGILSVHAYGGHDGGKDEMEAVESWMRALPFPEWSVAQYSICNRRRNPEILFLAHRR